ncbi:MAG: Fur family transcriptional regulator [Desulfuromonadaceae bacterium]
MHTHEEGSPSNTAPPGHMKMFEEICRQKRLRVTPQRLEIYGELARASDHPTAEILYQRLKDKMPSLSLDTVYRTLATLVSHNLIHRVESGQNQARFEVQHIDHHHIVCRKCNKIMDFTWDMAARDSLQDELKDWGKVERAQMVAYGICNACNY